MKMTPDQIHTFANLYYSSKRYYHTFNHALEMVELFTTGKTRGVVISNYTMPDFGVLHDEFISAIIAHDCIYEFGKEKGFNEKQSLKAWGRVMGRTEGDFGVVEPLILATIHHTPESVDCAPEHLEMVKTIIDLDLAGLGGDPEEFDRNSKNIALEIMGGIPNLSIDDYITGRNAFFQSMLDRESIYYTEQFKDTLEQRARDNIKREMNS